MGHGWDPLGYMMFGRVQSSTGFPALKSHLELGTLDPGLRKKAVHSHEEQNSGRADEPEVPTAKLTCYLPFSLGCPICKMGMRVSTCQGILRFYVHIMSSAGCQAYSSAQ